MEVVGSACVHLHSGYTSSWYKFALIRTAEPSVGGYQLFSVELCPTSTIMLKLLLPYCRTGATSFASSVTSLSSPRNLEMNDSAVELMVKTIEDQEQEIQASRKQIMIKMRAVEKLSREEEKLRYASCH